MALERDAGTGRVAWAEARPPTTTLPKSNGAIRSNGFAPHAVTGTGSLSIPVTKSPGKCGFGPELFLPSDAGAGNGPFGFGWNLSIPFMTHNTDKGLPRHQDAEASDVFILSGSDDVLGKPTRAWHTHSFLRRTDYGTCTRVATDEAVNRPTSITSSDGSTYWPSFNEVNLLEKVGADLRAVDHPTAFANDIESNGKTQRESIRYGSAPVPTGPGVTTRYMYGPETFRGLSRSCRPLSQTSSCCSTSLAQK